MDPPDRAMTLDELVVELRAAGCVFAEEEADLLLEAAPDAAGLRALTDRRVRGEPLEHVIGWVDFGGLRLHVGPGAFVPRQRSLFVAGLAADHAVTLDHPTVVELCCGVAPLAAFVTAAHSGARVVASDVDEAVLALARRNLPGGEVCRSALFADLPSTLRGTVDVVAAVPPYVPTDALAEMPREAREHEPVETLLGGADGLDVVRAILDDAGGWLSPGGVVLLELNVRQARSAIEHARRRGLDATSVSSPDGQTGVLRARLGAGG